MKRFTTRFLIFSALLSLIVVSAGAQPVQNTSETARSHPTYSDIENYYHEYWKAHDSTKRKNGWKQYKRWQWFWEQRLAPMDTLPPATILYDEWQKEKLREEQLQKEEQRSGGKRGREKTYAGTWTLVGPDTIPLDRPIGAPTRQYNSGVGRINCVRFQPGSATILWIGTAGGGAWRSTNGGQAWTNKTQHLPVLGISDIAIDPITTANVYIATGDANPTTNPASHYPIYSIGVMKSSDGGTNWTATGLLWSTTSNLAIYRLLIHPVTTAILIAATSNGLWRTIDHGANWSQVGPAGRRFTDLEFKPGDPNTVYAAAFASGVNAAQIYVSNDAGQTWTPVADPNLPADLNTGRIALAVTPATSGTVFALYTNNAQGFRGLYRSTTAGISWTVQSDNTSTTNILSHTMANIAGGQGFYDLALAVSSTNPNCVVAGGINVWHSTTAGVSWVVKSHWAGIQGVPYMHGDHHDIVFPPGNGSTVYIGNDGGVCRSTNATTDHNYANIVWDDNLSEPLSIMQFYRLGGSATSANLIVGGAQDNGTNICTNGTARHWQHGIGGDGMECAVDQTNASIVYGSREHGILFRSNDGGQTFTQKMPTNQASAWVTPYILHATTAQVLYIGYINQVFRSPDHGDTYAPIPGIFPGLLISMAQSPSHPDIMYAATANNIRRTTTCNVTAGASTWQDLTPALTAAAGGPLPSITYIAVAAKDPNKVWVTLSGYTANRKVFYSEDGGVTWQNISGGLPNLPVNCITYQKNSPDQVYAGTDLGVYYRHANMKQWMPFKDNLPQVVVTELEVQQSAQKLRAATYGRGIWQSGLADLPPLMLLKPNGGEVWVNGTTNTIRWFSQSTVGNVRLEYSLTSGATWTTIVGSTSSTTGSYTWLTPDIWSTRALIRVTSATPMFSDVSDSVFTIVPAIRLVAPNGGEKFPVASTTAIRWAIHPQITVTSLTIQCRLSTTSSWTTIATVPVAGTSGTYIWRTPVQTSTQAAVRIFFITTATTTSAGVTTALISDASDSTFSIINPLRVVAPNGAERIAVTSATGIRWELHTQATVTSLTFQYRLNPASAWVTIATVPVAPGATTGTQAWTTPTTATAQARVRIFYETTSTWIMPSTAASTTATIDDISDNDFSLVKPLALLFPNGGQNFPANTPTNITWALETNANVGATHINIEYSTNAGASWITLTTATAAAPRSYPWTVPDVSTTQALVRITCTTNANWTDTSDNTFTISTTATCANMAVQLDGNDDYLEASNLTPASSFTLEAWVIPHSLSSTKSGANTSEQYILFRRNSQTGTGNEAVALIFDEDNQLFKAVATSALGVRTEVLSPVGSADLFTASHLAVTLSGSEMSLYLNGRLQGRKSTGYGIDFADSTLWFGRTGDAANDGWFNGVIDEVRLWSAVRSESDIYGAMYQRHLPPAALAGYWHFDNATAGSAPDASGNGNPATLHNGAQVISWPDSVSRFTWHIEGPGLIVAPTSTGTYSVPAVTGTGYQWSVQNGAITSGQGTNQVTVEWNADSTGLGSIALTSTPLLACATYAELTVEFVGCQNYALSFDGWFDEVELINSKLVLGQNFTLEAWVNPSSTADSTFRSILGSRQLHDEERPPLLAVEGNAVVVGFGDGTNWNETRAASALTSGIWQHVAATFDGTTLKIYIDGEERHSTGALSGLIPFPAPIGYVGSGEGTFWGTIDEVRIWNSARSQSDIQKAMYCRFATAQAGMSAYWKFDENYYWWSSMAHDIAGYNDGVISGAWRTFATLPAPEITGPDSVEANTGGHVYCVPESACDTYTWSIYGGAITSGQDTRCVTVEWYEEPYGILSVSTEGMSSCGSYTSMYVAILPPPIIVVYPDSGDTVTGGMPTSITWSQSYYATTSTVSIELSLDGGASWSYITTATPSFYGTHSYAWTPPAVATTTALVRITDVSDPAIGDIGGFFEIIIYLLPPPITVVYPDSGDTVTGGMPTSITWSQSYYATTSIVSIELSLDGGASWSYITTATPSFYGTHSYAWTPPAVATTTALVRITDVSDPAIGDIGGFFEIIMYVLLPPDTVVATGDDGMVHLAWAPSSSPGVTGYNIYARPEYSGSFSLRATVGAGTTFFSDGAVVNGTRYYYALTAINGSGESALSAIVSAVPTGTTLMLVSPNGGEIFVAGTQVPINWKSSSPQDGVAIEYSCNGMMWYPIATVYGDMSYVWTVPYPATVYGRVRVRSISGAASDISDGSFTVRSGYETAVNVRLFLEGPYTGMGSMSTSLQMMGQLPMTQPYSIVPFNYFGMETRNMCVTDPVVDWVLVDIRSAMNPSISMARTAALLRSDGTLLDESGYPEVLVGIPPGMYYIVIMHRNHLEVMSATPVYLATGSSMQYTFTTGQSQAYQVFMPTLKQVDIGTFALSAGEAQHDDVINADDRVRVINAVGRGGYVPEDVTMDGVVTALDRIMTENNQFLISQVP